MEVDTTAKDVVDADLMRLVSNGDQAAFRILMGRYLPRILRIGERMTGNQSSAEDIAQEALMRLWKKAREWDHQGRAQVSTWLYRVTVNLCIDKSRQISPGSLEGLEEELKDQTEILGELHNRQIQDLIKSLLDTLSKQQRLVIILSYYEEMTAKEIGDIMDLSPNAVAALLHRARKQLKAGLEKLGVEGWNHDRKG